VLTLGSASFAIDALRSSAHPMKFEYFIKNQVQNKQDDNILTKCLISLSLVNASGDKTNFNMNTTSSLPKNI